MLYLFVNGSRCIPCFIVIFCYASYVNYTGVQEKKNRRNNSKRKASTREIRLSRFYGQFQLVEAKKTVGKGHSGRLR